MLRRTPLDSGGVVGGGDLSMTEEIRDAIDATPTTTAMTPIAIQVHSGIRIGAGGRLPFFDERLLSAPRLVIELPAGSAARSRRPESAGLAGAGLPRPITLLPPRPTEDRPTEDPYFAPPVSIRISPRSL